MSTYEEISSFSGTFLDWTEWVVEWPVETIFFDTSIFLLFFFVDVYLSHFKGQKFEKVFDFQTHIFTQLIQGVKTKNFWVYEAGDSAESEEPRRLITEGSFDEENFFKLEEEIDRHEAEHAFEIVEGVGGDAVVEVDEDIGLFGSALGDGVTWGNFERSRGEFYCLPLGTFDRRSRCRRGCCGYRTWRGVVF